MSIIEADALVRVKDNTGQEYLVYPVTKASNVDGLGEYTSGVLKTIIQAMVNSNPDVPLDTLIRNVLNQINSNPSVPLNDLISASMANSKSSGVTLSDYERYKFSSYKTYNSSDNSTLKTKVLIEGRGKLIALFMHQSIYSEKVEVYIDDELAFKYTNSVTNTTSFVCTTKMLFLDISSLVLVPTYGSSNGWGYLKMNPILLSDTPDSSYNNSNTVVSLKSLSNAPNNGGEVLGIFETDSRLFEKGKTYKDREHIIKLSPLEFNSKLEIKACGGDSYSPSNTTTKSNIMYELYE